MGYFRGHNYYVGGVGNITQGMGRELQETFPVAMDSRGRMTIPANIRQAYDLDPDEGEEVWLRITIEESDIRGAGGDQ